MFSSGEENKIDLFEPGTLVFFIMAFVADVFLLGLLGLAIPGIGLAIAMFVLMAHWGIGFIILIYFWSRSHGWLAKLILILFWILPLPLTVGLLLMMFASNGVGAFLIEQAAIQVIAIATAGGGEALEAGALAAEGAEAAGAGVEAAGALAEGAEAGGAAAEGAEAAGAGAEGAGAGAGEAGAEGTEAAGEGAEGAEEADTLEPSEEKNPMENLEKDLTQPQEEHFPEEPGEGDSGPEGEEPEKEEPDKDKKDKPAERLKKVFDVLDRTNQQQPTDKKDDEEEDDLAEAA